MIGVVLNNRYEITAAIGRGAMGEVYRAADKQTGGAVAVKILAGQLAFDAEMIERFRREGEALQQLRHPNIVGLVDTFQHEGRQVIVLEFVPGGSLHALLKREAPLDLPRVRRIALELCDALTRAHHLSIIHRDIKPENVLMAEDGTPCLTDFGVARLVGDATRLTGTGTQIGTPYYMSPEAWEGEQLDARSDIWSLGIMLYEMLSGQVPFGGETLAAVMNKVLTAPLPDVRSLRPDVPDAWVRVLNKMLTRDKAKRYQSMRQVAADLEQGAPSEAPKTAQKARPAAKPKPKPARAEGPAEPRVCRRTIWAWAVAGGFLVVIVGGALFAAGIISLPTNTAAIVPMATESQATSAATGDMVLASGLTIGSPETTLLAYESGNYIRVRDLRGTPTSVEEWDDVLGHFTRRDFAFTAPEGARVLWHARWCTIDTATLESNLENMQFEFSVDGETLPDSAILSVDALEPLYAGVGTPPGPDYPCRMNIALVWSWPAGTTVLQTVTRFTSAVNDGLDDFPMGGLYFVDRVTAP